MTKEMDGKVFNSRQIQNFASVKIFSKYFPTFHFHSACKQSCFEEEVHIGEMTVSILLYLTVPFVFSHICFVVYCQTCLISFPKLKSIDESNSVFTTVPLFPLHNGNFREQQKVCSRC